MIPITITASTIMSMNYTYHTENTVPGMPVWRSNEDMNTL